MSSNLCPISHSSDKKQKIASSNIFFRATKLNYKKGFSITHYIIGRLSLSFSQISIYFISQFHFQWFYCDPIYLNSWIIAPKPYLIDLIRWRTFNTCLSNKAWDLINCGFSNSMVHWLWAHFSWITHLPCYNSF